MGATPMPTRPVASTCYPSGVIGLDVEVLGVGSADGIHGGIRAGIAVQAPGIRGVKGIGCGGQLLARGEQDIGAAAGRAAHFDPQPAGGAVEGIGAELGSSVEGWR